MENFIFLAEVFIELENGCHVAAPVGIKKEKRENIMSKYFAIHGTVVGFK